MFNYLKNRISIPLTLLFLYNLVYLFLPARGGKEALPTMDSVFFMSIAYNILHFGDMGWVAYHEPPLFSIAIAILSFLTDDLLNAAILVSKVSILLLIIPTYMLGKEIFGEKVGLISAVLVTFMPHIRAIAFSPESEPLYALLLTSATYFLWLTYKRQAVSLSIVTGILFTLAYLTRSEGLLIFFFLLFSLVILQIKKRILNKRLMLSLTVTFFVFIMSSLPYFLFLRDHYGVWTLGTKSSAIYFWVREKSFKDPDPERSEWGLSSKGELNMISMTSKDLINYWLKDPAKSIRVYLRSLKGHVPGFIPNTSGQFHFPQVYPLYFAIPLLLGLLIRIRGKDLLDGDFYLMSVFYILFIYNLFTEGWARYLVNYLPIFMILAASGLNEINEGLKVYLIEKGVWKKIYGNSLLWMFVLGTSSYHLWVMAERKPPVDMVRHNERKHLFALETKKAGEWAQKRFPPGSNYMVGWSRLPYYLDGRWTARPETTGDMMIWYARKNRVDYIVFETSGKGESNELIRVMGNTPDLEVAGVYEGKSKGSDVVFLKLKK